MAACNLYLLVILCMSIGTSMAWPKSTLVRNGTSTNQDIDHDDLDNISESTDLDPTPCNCGIFLSGQFKKGTLTIEDEDPVLLLETETTMYPCGHQGNKQCLNKCIEMIAAHLPKAGPMVCGAIERDCFREKAYLFIQNCDDAWNNTKFSAGKEFCCKDGESYKCPRRKRITQRHISRTGY